MNVRAGHRIGGMVLALSLGLASIGVANAQQAQQPPSGAGVLLGEVDKCVGGAETPVPGVSVGVVGGDPNQALSDNGGVFSLVLAPGQYTIQATAADGSTANRPYVPVEANSTLDIGVLELAGGCAGSADITAPPAPAPAPAQATVQPTVAPTATELPTTPTPLPTVPAPTATPAPAPAQESPPDQPPDAASDAG
jgi:hypothetical protein